MTLDQKIALFNAFGAWAAAIATVAAVIVSLLLATRAAKVKLKFGVGLFLIFLGDGTKPTQELIFKVTNLGDRPVTVNGVGWVIGSRWRKRKRRHAYQLLHSPNSAQPPTQLNHGDSAAFSVSLALTPDWAINLGRDLVQDVRDLPTLRGQVYTTVGQTVEAKPTQELIDYIAKAMVGTTGIKPDRSV